MYRLKKGQESFQVVDGPAAGRKFERGVEYDRPPQGEEWRFETINLNPPIPKDVVADPAGPEPEKSKNGGENNAFEQS